jgi:predicted AlkP superfamily phosphohydrolase/phosphomutase
VTPINALKWLTAWRLGGLRKNVKRGRGGRLLRRFFLSFNDVEWARTKAFSVGNFGQVYLNVEGKRPSGAVTPAEYEALRDEIAQAAMALLDPADGSQVVPKVYKREEIFHGRSIERLPDLVLHTDRAKYVSFGHADFGSNRIIESSVGQTGHHHLIGVVGLKGPGVHVGFTLEEASILDLAPTILHYLGLPVPAYMDGQVLTAAFTEEFNQLNPVQHHDGDFSQPAEDMAYGAEEEELVLAKLRDMGYVA